MKFFLRLECLLWISSLPFKQSAFPLMCNWLIPSLAKSEPFFYSFDQFAKPPCPAHCAFFSHRTSSPSQWDLLCDGVWFRESTGYFFKIISCAEIPTKPHHGDSGNKSSILCKVADIGDTWKHQVYHSKKYSVMLLKYFGSRNICWYSVIKSITEYFFHNITCFGDDKVRF